MSSFDTLFPTAIFTIIAAPSSRFRKASSLPTHPLNHLEKDDFFIAFRRIFKYNVK